MALTQTIQEHTQQLSADEVRQLGKMLQQSKLSREEAVLLMEKVPLLSGNRGMSHGIIARAGKIVHDMIQIDPNTPESLKNVETMRRAGRYLCTLNFGGIPKEQRELEFANLDPFMKDDQQYKALKNKQLHRKLHITYGLPSPESIYSFPAGNRSPRNTDER